MKVDALPPGSRRELLETIAKIQQAIKDKSGFAGWKVTCSTVGLWTIQPPSRPFVRIPPTFDDSAAEQYLGKLRSSGVAAEQLRMSKSAAPSPNKRATKAPQKPVANPAFANPAFANPAFAAPTATATKIAAVPEMRPPVYDGDPSPDAGEVRKLVLLTPELALELKDRAWQATNSDGVELQQRPLIEANVAKFVKLIKRGKFVASYQGLGIGLNGSVYDGQHRIEAVIQSGEAVQVWINYNVDPKVIEALDSGAGRRTSAKLTMEGFENGLLLGSAARLLWYWQEYMVGVEEGDNDLSGPWSRWSQTRVDDTDTRKVVQDHSPELSDCVNWVVGRRQTKPKKNKPAAAVFRYLARTAWPEAAEEIDAFLCAILQSIGIDSPDHQAVYFAQWLERPPSKVHERNRREAELFMLLQAWEAHAKGKPRKGCNLDGQPPMPYRPKKKK